MTCEIISVGTEILLGEILNTNTQYISEELASIGIGVYYHTTVGDNVDRLKNILDIAIKRADLIIITGGLGPTKDDLTKETVADVLNTELYLDKDSLKNIQDNFEGRNYKMPLNNKKQALIPKGAKVLKNNNGTAPGCIVEEKNVIIIMLPGPPEELNSMFKESVKPYLIQKTDKVFYKKDLKISGIGESLVAEKIDDLIKNQKNPTIATYAKSCEMSIRIMASGKDNHEAKELVNNVSKQIYNKIAEHIYGEDEVSIQEVVVNKIKEKNMKISVAESLTGGMVAENLVNIPSASDILDESYVTYSDEAKIKLLGVNRQTLENYGDVSEETAKEMAIGVFKASKANIGLSTTGIAGPTGGTEEKPVGLVYIGVCINGDVKVYKHIIKGNREKIRLRTTILALDHLRREL